MNDNSIQRLRTQIRGLLKNVNELPDDPTERPADLRRVRAKLGAMNTLVEKMENGQS